jgi:hypothetical protein
VGKIDKTVIYPQKILCQRGLVEAMHSSPSRKGQHVQLLAAPAPCATCAII